MKIDQIAGSQLVQPALKTNPVQPEGASFGEMLHKALGEVNALQNQSAEMKTKLITGEIENVHDVLIASEKASVAFKLTLEMRNKVVEAYQEIMRMTV